MDGWRKEGPVIWRIVFIACFALGVLVLTSEGFRASIRNTPNADPAGNVLPVIDHVGESAYMRNDLVPFFGLTVGLLVLVSVLVMPAVRWKSRGLILVACLLACALWWFARGW